MAGDVDGAAALRRDQLSWRRAGRGGSTSARRKMIWQVTLLAPEINEIVVTEADDEEQAIERAVYSAVQRMMKAGEATAEVIPMPDSAA
jgi:hypothetical protein